MAVLAQSRDLVRMHLCGPAEAAGIGNTSN